MTRVDYQNIRMLYRRAKTTVRSVGDDYADRGPGAQHFTVREYPFRDFLTTEQKQFMQKCAPLCPPYDGYQWLTEPVIKTPKNKRWGDFKRAFLMAVTLGKSREEHLRIERERSSV